MIGPVCGLELRLGSRRGSLERLRRWYAGLLIAESAIFYGLCLLSAGEAASRPGPIRAFIDGFPALLVVQHFALVLMVTPGYAAGALASGPGRSTLPDLLATELSAWDIVAGKLLGRLAHVALLALPALPILAWMAAWHQDGARILAATVVLSAVLVPALGAAGMLAAVCCGRMRDAALLVYGVGILGASAAAAVQALALRPGSSAVLACVDPVSIVGLTPGAAADSLSGRVGIGVVFWGILGMLCLGLAVWRLRPAYVGRCSEGSKPAAAHRRPPVSEDDPIGWKEQEVDGLAIVPALRRMPRWVGLLGLFGALLLAVWADTCLPIGLVLLLLVATIVAIRASAAISGERERGTWEPLWLACDARTIVRAKFHGILRATYPYLLVAGLPPLIRAGWLLDPLPLIDGAVLLLTAWLAVYWMTAVGLDYSARSSSSRQSLAAGVGVGYGLGLVLLVAAVVTALPFLLVVQGAYGRFGSSASAGLFDLAESVLILAGAGLWCGGMGRTHLRLAEEYAALHESHPSSGCAEAGTPAVPGTVPVGPARAPAPLHRLRLTAIKRPLVAGMVLLLLAILWNPVTFITVTGALGRQGATDTGLCLLVVVSLIAVLLNISYLYQIAVAVLVPPTAAYISTRPVYPGQPFELRICQHGPLRLRAVEISLTCAQAGKPRQELLISRHQDLEIAALRPADMHCVYCLPTDAAPSNASKKHRVEWTILLRGQLVRWFGFERVFPVQVDARRSA
jgi:hypothetical protein